MVKNVFFYRESSSFIYFLRPLKILAPTSLLKQRFNRLVLSRLLRVLLPSRRFHSYFSKVNLEEEILWYQSRPINEDINQ